LNPLIEVIAIPEKVTKENAVTILNDYDIIVDGSDNFATRYLVNDTV
jgi:adenylyltransferase/sulfurtransferase